MREQCLVKKLKSVINNDNLIPIDTLRVQFQQNSFNNVKSQYFKVVTRNYGIVIKLIGEGYITETFGEPTDTKEIILEGGETKTYYVSNTDCYIDIHNIGTGLRTLELGGSGDGEFLTKTIINQQAIKYSGIENMNLRESKDLDLAYLPDIVGIFTLTYSAKGDFSVISGISIKRLDIRGTSRVTGSLDAALSAIQGQVSPELDIRDTPNLYKKRSTITALQNAGWVVAYTEAEVDENA